MKDTLSLLSENFPNKNYECVFLDLFLLQRTLQRYKMTRRLKMINRRIRPIFYTFPLVRKNIIIQLG